MHEVRGATAIDLTNSSFDVDPGILVLSGLDANGTPDTVRFTVSSGQVYVAVNGGSAYPLTDTHTTVDSLIFRHIGGGQAEGVRVEMKVHSLRALSPVVYTVSDTAALRKAQ
jgi:hypothetical protein